MFPVHPPRAVASRLTAGFLLCLLAAAPLRAQLPAEAFLPVSETSLPGAFRLAGGEDAPAPIYFDAADAQVVKIAAGLLAEDVERVTGRKPAVAVGAPAGNAPVVIVGTLGKNTVIDALVNDKKLNVGGVRGKWEAFVAQVVADPAPGIPQALVIAGSDRRGTAFGVFALSEAMGVSPWYWWADVPTAKKSAVYIAPGRHAEPSPAVKYRGIFLNDEDWGLQPWAAKTFEPEVGDIGPKTYAKICELLLRLRANYLWPAMHPCTQAFNHDPQNKQVADDYGIVMGSSHCEQMLRNNVSEYDEKALGPWDYFTNRDHIARYWEERVEENSRFENTYTLGMRGIHDSGMPGGGSMPEKVAKMQEIFADQRAMLARHVNPKVEQVPQIFVPYKEVLDLYRAGLPVPDDVTLVWPDDNHGYLRQLSTPAEQKRKGGAGVYYHLSYQGAPKDYLWLDTTPPALIWEEMTKAYDYGARTVWVCNVGDLKPGEIGLDFFLRLALNPEKYRNFSQSTYLRDWAERTFGVDLAHAGDIANLLDAYYTRNHPRPEHLDPHYSGFTAIEADDRVAAMQQDIADPAQRLASVVRPEARDAFYELVLYPALAATATNAKILLAENSRLHASQGLAVQANADAQRAREANARIAELTDFYNTKLADGKWKGMMSANPHNLPVYPMPATGAATLKAPSYRIAVTVGDDPVPMDAEKPGELPPFQSLETVPRVLHIFNNGAAPMSWSAEASAPWIWLDIGGAEEPRDVNVDEHRTLNVRINWEKAPQGAEVKGTVTISGGGDRRTVGVTVHNPDGAALEAGSIPATESEGVINVKSVDFTENTPAGGAGWKRVESLTATGDGLTVFPVTAASIDPAAVQSKAPSLEYELSFYGHGPTTIETHCLPTHRIHEGRGLRYAIALNDEKPRVVDVDAEESSPAWSRNVLRGEAVGVSGHFAARSGRQTLRVWMVDPGVVLDHFVIRPGAATRGGECENLPVAGYKGAAPRGFVEAHASNGAASALEAKADGDFITYLVPGVESGAYDLTARVKKSQNCGETRLSIADEPRGAFTDYGDEYDLFSPAEEYADLPPVRVEFGSAGDKFLHFRVTGRNPANTSGASWLVFDRLTLTPVTR